MKINLKASTGNPWSPQPREPCLMSATFSNLDPPHCTLQIIKNPKITFFLFVWASYVGCAVPKQKMKLKQICFAWKWIKVYFCMFRIKACLSVCLSILYLRLFLNVFFLILHMPDCQLAFSSSSWTSLSACFFILFPNLSVGLPFHSLPEPDFSLWFTSLSVNMPKCILL
jgi:hypothetical protein